VGKFKGVKGNRDHLQAPHTHGDLVADRWGFFTKHKKRRKGNSRVGKRGVKKMIYGELIWKKTLKPKKPVFESEGVTGGKVRTGKRKGGTNMREGKVGLGPGGLRLPPERGATQKRQK